LKEKRENMSIATGLILLSAVLLFGGASHILADDVRISVALLLGSLWLLTWGLIKGFKAVGLENPDTGTRSAVSFGQFNVADSKFPWCTETRYKIAYETNGVVGELSEATLPIQSTTKTDPIFTVKTPPVGANVLWYRLVGPIDGGNSYINHTASMVLFGTPTSDSLNFMDTSNPCLPDPPPMPVPAGTVGDNLFTLTAGEGEVPWCIRTRYFATYVKHGTESNPSPLSVEFQSNEFTRPRLTVPARPGFEINWYREDGVITNTPFMAERGPNNQHMSRSEPIGNGPTFTDMQNPCQIPNPPTSDPIFRKFDFEF
jgi:hypothetical protein